MTTFKDVFIVSGSGVGGGSLGYANTLYRARPAFFGHPQWDGLAEDWEAELAPHYDTAERMLGVTTYEGVGPADALLRQFGEEIGRRRHLEEHPGRRLLRARRRAGRRSLLRRRGAPPHGLRALRAVHGRLPLRREEHAAQELPLVRREARRDASRRSARLRTSARWAPATDPRATRSRPSAPERGFASSGVRSAPGEWCSPPARSARTCCCVECKERGSLGRISERLGELVRTNSESIMAVTAPDDERDFSRVGRDHVEHLPGPRHARRGRHLRQGRRFDELAVHADDRRRDADDAAGSVAQAGRTATPSSCCARSGPCTGRGGR